MVPKQLTFSCSLFLIFLPPRLFLSSLCPFLKNKTIVKKTLTPLCTYPWLKHLQENLKYSKKAPFLTTHFSSAHSHNLSSMSGRRVALLLGSNGALGREIAKAYAARNWSVLGFDVADKSMDPTLVQAYHTLPLSSTAEEMQRLLRAHAKEFGSGPSAVINAAGGWTGGDVKDAELAAKTYQMLHQSLFSSLAAANVAALTVRRMLTEGAVAALQPPRCWPTVWPRLRCITWFVLSLRIRRPCPRVAARWQSSQ